MKKLWSNWGFLTVIITIISFLVVYYLIGEFGILEKKGSISLVIAIIIGIVFASLNPLRRYLKFAYFLSSIFLILNKFFFHYFGFIDNHFLEVGSDKIRTPENIALLIAICLCLILDHLARKGKLNGTFLQINNYSNTIGDVSGSGHTIIQNSK